MFPNLKFVEEPNRIRVQLAGVTDQNEARKILSSQANLTIRDAEDKVKLSGSDIKQDLPNKNLNRKQQPATVTFKVKRQKQI